MTQTKAKRGFFGKVLAAACSVALVASLTPAAAMTAFADSTSDQKITVKVQGTDASGNVFKMFNATISAGEFAGINQTTYNFYSGSAWASASGTGYDLKSFLELAKAPSTGNYKNDGSAAKYYDSSYNPTIKVEGKSVTGYKSSVTTTYKSLTSNSWHFGVVASGDKKGQLTNSSGTNGGMKPVVVNNLKVAGSNAPGLATSDYAFVQPMPAWGSMSNEDARIAIGKNRIVSQVNTITLTIPYSEYKYAQRIAGEDWSDTMVDAVKAGWSESASNNIIVTTSANFPDALAASGMAGVLNCPVIMTEPAALTQQTSDLIDWLAVAGGANVYVIGGPVVVSDATLDTIKNLGSVKDVERIYGQDADQTALEIYEWVVDNEAWGYKDTNNASAYALPIVCTSATFKDALCAAPLAFAQKTPIFLTQADLTLRNATVDAIEEYTDAHGLKKAQLVGGPAVISEAVDAQLLDEDIYVDRIWGQTEFQTSSQLASKVLEATKTVRNSTDVESVAICTSVRYEDALSAINWCGTRKDASDKSYFAPVLLVDNDNTYALTNFLQNNGPDANGKIKSAKVFGGTGIIDTDVQALANSILNPID